MIETYVHQPTRFSFLPPMPLPPDIAPLDDGYDVIRRSEPLPLSVAEVDGVLARNTMARVTHALDGGTRRTRRARYVFVAGNLYVPATACPYLFAESSPVQLECDVSEIAGLSHWRYVWASGPAAPLHPTGAAAEREEWRYGVELLRRVMFELGAIQDLTFANYGIARITIASRSGVHLSLE